MSRDLLFEIGVEEIPSAPLYEAISQLRTDAEKALNDARLGYDTLQTFGAPRRLVLQVTGLAERQDDQTLRARGPAVKAAFDAEGIPTKAAEGFARGKGVDVSALERVTDDSGSEYVYAVVEQVGRDARAVLPEILAELAEGLSWPKSQRWGSGAARFIRPVRWLLAIFGEDILPVEFAGLIADRYTNGHRFLSSDRRVPVASAGDYDAAARRGMFVYDHEERARLVREGIAAVEQQHGVRAVVPEKTFAEVVNLVEWPTVVVGKFDEEFLEVPREVIETAMTKHQRYFPLEGPDGALTNLFVVVHNGDPACTDGIVSGHERVIRARLADATFFYREDLKVNMEDWVTRLDAITFQEKLGSSGAKVWRNEQLAGTLAELHGADPGESAEAVRAAHLCKADLVSHVVVEFPVLQGVMGRYYALAAGETEPVANAVLQHYQPRFAGDALPPSTVGMIASAADKLDTMVGIFAIGQGPTGSADPYALRRGAIGILTMILDGGLRLDLTAAISAALAGYEGVLEGLAPNSVGESVRSFVVGRLEVIMRDRGIEPDVVDAVIAAALRHVGEVLDPADIMRRATALRAFRESEAGRDLAVAFKRAANLAQPDLGTEPDRDSLVETAETVLFEALDRAASGVTLLMADHDYEGALALLAELREPVDTFFDDVLVMAEDEAVRANRLRLLNRLVGLIEDFADFTRLTG
ncbi:MAG: glycine--tRNA ligase subunit beta [Actinomycetota bacterium]|nr:glycine--tRNA ligase subunit beta [Actinomycetota bacterium]